jgi:porin
MNQNLLGLIPDTIYNQAGVYRSQPVHGPSGNPFLDEAILDPTGFQWGGVGTRALAIDEVGWKNEAAPGMPKTWFCAGIIHNFSDMTDFSRLAENGTIRGGTAGYVLMDRQLWQQAPGSHESAYRGLYGGLSGMWAEDKITPFTSYYEARLYWIGALDFRPSDMISFVYARNNVNKYLANIAVPQDRSWSCRNTAQSGLLTDD